MIPERASPCPRRDRRRLVQLQAPVAHQQSNECVGDALGRRPRDERRVGRGLGAVGLGDEPAAVDDGDRQREPELGGWAISSATTARPRQAPPPPATSRWATAPRRAGPSCLVPADPLGQDGRGGCSSSSSTSATLRPGWPARGARAEEQLVDGPVEQREQRLAEALHVEDHHGLGVHAELGPGERSRTAPRTCRGRPGSAMKPSARSAMSALRSCIEPHDAQLGEAARGRSPWPASASGITPITSPPAAMAASATTPISPTSPPPYTTPSPRRARVAPSSAAVAA